MKNKLILTMPLCYLLSSCGIDDSQDAFENTNQAPVASFSVDRTTASINTNISFTDNSSDDTGVDEWLWDFGDGTTSSSTNPIYQYSSPGSYEVVLTVTDNAGLTTTASATTITVLNEPPLASFSVSTTSPRINEQITFTNESTDNAGEIVAVLWDFGDNLGTSEAANPSYTYLNSGDYTVTLTVTDNDGASSHTSSIVSVFSDAPPTAVISVSNAAGELNPTNHLVEVGETLTFNASDSTDDNAISTTSWDFADGSAQALGERVEYAFTQAGTYNVKVTVTDDIGQSSSEQFTVFVPIDWRSQNIGDIDSTSPVVSADDSKVFMAGDGDRSGDENQYLLVGLNTADGTDITGFPIDITNVLRVTPVIDDNGDLLVTPNKQNVVVGNVDFDDGVLIAVNTEDGTINWSEVIGTDNSDPRYGSMALGVNGDVYVSQRDNGVRFAAVASGGTGNLKWSYASASDDFQSVPAISADGSTIYACDTQGVLHAMYAEEQGTADGQADTKWSIELGDGCSTSLAVSSNGNIIVAGSSDTTDGGFVASVSDYTTEASLNWKIDTAGDIDQGGVVIGENDVVYAGTKKVAEGVGKLLALNSQTGIEVCHYEIAEGTGAAPALSDNGHVYIGDEAGSFHIIDAATCQLVNLLDADKLGSTKVWSSAAIDDNGSVYVGMDTEQNVNGNDSDDRGKLFKLELGATGALDSAWPMKGQNKRRTSRQ